MRLVRALLLLALTACTQAEPLLLPGSTAKSLVLVETHPALGTTLLYAISRPFAALTGLAPEDQALAFEFERDLTELGLEPGALTLTAASPRRSPLPTPMARYRLNRESLVQLETSTVGLELPAIDREAILRSGRCVALPGYVSSACGSTTSFDNFQVQAPAPPDLSPEQCPLGWSRAETRVDRGPILGAVVQAYCEPPARRRCGPRQMQAAGDAECHAVGEPCPAGDFATVTATRVFYVRAGATAGDGSRPAPFARISEALSALGGSPGAIALAPGSYPEDVVLRGRVDLIGGCASSTELAGALSLEGHQGLVSNLRVRGNATAVLRVGDGARSRAAGVELSGATGVLSCSVFGGSELRIEDGLLGGDDGDRSLATDGSLTLERSELRGHLSAERATISILGSVLSSTGSEVHSYALNSAVNIERSRVRVPLSVLEESRLQVRRSWFDLDVPSTRFERDSLVAEGPELTVEQSVFATETILVPEPAFPGEPTVGQVSIVVRTARTRISDSLFLLPRAASTAVVEAINLYHPVQVEPARLERIMVVGGTKLPQVFIAADVVASDLSGYDCSAEALLMVGGKLSLSRFEAARTRDGLTLGSNEPITAALRDLRIADETNIGLLLRSPLASLSADIARTLVLSGPRDTIGVSIRADSDQHLEARLRDVKIEAQVSTGLDLGVDARVDLERFSISRGGVGLTLHHRPRNGYVPRGLHLRRGTIDAGVLGVQLPDVPVDLDLLLDQVALEAPTLFQE